MSNEIIEKEESGLANLIDLKEMLGEEMAGLTPTFERIKIPSGGGIAYEIPGDDPESPDMAKEFKAVILYQHPISTYYKEKFDGSNNRPDCGSSDGVIGVNVETGEITECGKCEFNKFGSADDGSGKACKQKRRIYILKEGDMFPTVLVLPTGSLKEFSKYLMRLMNKNQKPNSVVTKFSLKKAQNTTGINYSQAVFAKDRDLTEQEKIAVANMGAELKKMAQGSSGVSEE
ncbi:MAG: hypothetical protein R3Y32_03210 [Bacillota bacterium]